MKKRQKLFLGKYQIMIHGCKINGPYEKAGNTQETIMRLLEKKKDDYFYKTNNTDSVCQTYNTKTSVFLFFSPNPKKKNKKDRYCSERIMTKRKTHKRTKKKEENLRRSRRWSRMMMMMMMEGEKKRGDVIKLFRMKTSRK